ncbi:MAG: restriction endonuclease subunit S [Roseburia sp.]|nr:restriction endonuclease subunit S [Roseburia sp.]
MLTFLLSDIADFSYGVMPKKELFNQGNIPVFSGYQITGTYPKYNLEENELVLIARGVGGTGDVKLTPCRCWLTNLSIHINLLSSAVSKNYLYYYFLAHNLRWLNSGSAQPQITIKDLANVKICVPNTEIQNHIVDTIRTLFLKSLLLFLQEPCLRL